ncbi:flagellar filament capping protein FliD [Thermomicrobiaceae bacterium CFH 74404]|uniref:Flagellar hook-associated protein 2 n=1 Tax=Thermalbibacter longus TaxID=2951981 RepID=A0AA41WBM0_9BACT|nr:flagellar filament capping protein FliD [Thermalbibacter longus]MCM8749727.1 flagellar filament capping protein FliD [Thermalbibacter longus]
MSVFRVDGLASGLNTTDIIEKLLQLEQQPIQRLQTRKLEVEAERDAWRDLGARLQNLSSALQPLLLRGTVTAFAVKPSDSNPPFTATAGSGAVPGSYSILVSQLATSTVARSSGAVGADIDPNALLKDGNYRKAITAGSFSINGVSISIDPNADTLNDVIDRINTSGAGVTASLVTVDGRTRLQLAANTPGGPIQLGSGSDTSNFLDVASLLAAPRVGDTVTGTRSLGAVKSGEPLTNAALATAVTAAGTLTINGVEIAYDPAIDSLSTVINRINASSAGVTASYDAATDRVILTSKATGSQTIGLSDTGNLLAALNIDPQNQQLGQNAVYSLDGGATFQYSASNTVTDAIPGVSLTLTRTTSTAYSFTVEADPEPAVAAVKKFVEQFNSVLSFIQDKTSYDANTKKAGTLMADGAVRSIEATLRRMISSPAVDPDGAYAALSEIGISFGAIGSAVGTTNQLQLDETKLRNALANNPNAVYDLFAATSGATLTTSGDIVAVSGKPTEAPSSGRYVIISDGTGNLTAEFRDESNNVLWTNTSTITAGGTNSTLIPGLVITAASTLTGAQSEIQVTYRDGVLQRLDRYLDSTLGAEGVVSTRGDGFQQRLRQIDLQMERFEARLEDRRAQLIRQFSALERLLAEMQQQGAQLGMQLASLMGSGQ